MKRHLFLALLFAYPTFTFSENHSSQKNKLLEMFRFFYLPFEIDFHLGDFKDEVIPVIQTKGSPEPLVVAPIEMQKLDQYWTQVRNSWLIKSFFNDTKVELNKSVKISSHLIAHRISSTRGALDSLSIEDRIRIKELLKGKSKEIQGLVLQKQFVRSFIEPDTIEKTHFFIIAPNWCASSESYRTVLEAYTRRFALGNFVLHSIVIEDPKEEIFDSRAMNDLFPFPKNYSHESVPRFLMSEVKDGEFKVHEEGNALHILYKTYFSNHQGFMENENPLREKRSIKTAPSRTLSKLSIP